MAPMDFKIRLADVIQWMLVIIIWVFAVGGQANNVKNIEQKNMELAIEVKDLKVEVINLRLEMVKLQTAFAKR